MAAAGPCGISRTTAGTTELEKKVFFHLQNPTTRRILEILAASPEVSRKDIAGTMGIAGPSITWHTKRLSGDGIISTSKKGTAVRYTLCPAGLNVFRQFTGDGVGASSGSAAAGDEPGNNPLKITSEAVIVPIHFLTCGLLWRDF